MTYRSKGVGFLDLGGSALCRVAGNRDIEGTESQIKHPTRTPPLKNTCKESECHNN